MPRYRLNDLEVLTLSCNACVQAGLRPIISAYVLRSPSGAYELAIVCENFSNPTHQRGPMTGQPSIMTVLKMPISKKLGREIDEKERKIGH